MKIPTLLMALVATSVGYLTPASTVSALLILSPPPSPPLALDGNRPQQRHSCCSASSFAYKSNIVGNARRLSRDHERADASPATKRDALKMMVSSSMGGSSPARLVLNDGERRKLNDGADAFFYNYPRMCYHVDQGFLTHLTDLYRERIPAGGAVLDMMSSWVSHLPADVTYSRVDGQGMNFEELNRNQRLDAKRVWDLNADPRLPFDDEAYDAVICCVSVQYLQQPETVLADVRRVLKPGGVAIFSFSNRMFSDKAIKGWINRTDKGRLRLVTEYFNSAGGFGAPEAVERDAQEGAGFFSGFADMFGMAGKGDPFLAVVATKTA